MKSLPSHALRALLPILTPSLQLQQLSFDEQVGQVGGDVWGRGFSEDPLDVAFGYVDAVEDMHQHLRLAVEQGGDFGDEEPPDILQRRPAGLGWCRFGRDAEGMRKGLEGLFRQVVIRIHKAGYYAGRTMFWGRFEIAFSRLLC